MSGIPWAFEPAKTNDLDRPLSLSGSPFVGSRAHPFNHFPSIVDTRPIPSRVFQLVLNQQVEPESTHHLRPSLAASALAQSNSSPM